MSEPTPSHTSPVRIDAALVARLISSVTGRDEESVLEQLNAEFRSPGSTVAREVRLRGIEPYVHSSKIDALYSGSDAFLFESAIWNRNRLKRRMRRWVRKRLDALRVASGRDALDVLVIGDGPGFDSLEFAIAGHNVTYHELPGFQEAFARRLFDVAGQSVHVLTDRSELQLDAFDAVTCLDVLEHVDDPPSVVRSLVAYLRPDGVLFAHAPFYMIHPAYPTHLHANRRYSGRLSLYEEAGLQLLDGEFGWNPLMFARRSGEAAALMTGKGKLLAIRAAGAYFTLGRWFSLPFWPVHLLRRAQGRWFQ